MKLAAGTQGSVVVERCQVCDSENLKSVVFVGYLPPVNTMPTIGSRLKEEPSYPAELLACDQCGLFQLGLIVDPEILFPPTYPYTSGTTKILRENFAELSTEVATLYPLKKEDLVVDIGSNDGTLLSNFTNYRVFGVEPTNAGKLARERGIDTLTAFFSRDTAKQVVTKVGKAKIITATNVFAHIENIHEIVNGVLDLLTEDGLFISESHYLLSLIETMQYDTIYHEHLRYYSVSSLQFLLEQHGLELNHVKRIPTHGGSIRVYASRKGTHPVKESVGEALAQERAGLSPESLLKFREEVMLSKLSLYSLLSEIKSKRERVYGIGAPSRASTLINYVGLDETTIDAVLEISGSYKIGKYIPGTVIPVLDENLLFTEQPEYALLFSWHIADELIPKLKGRGFKGKFIVPLPEPRIVS